MIKLELTLDDLNLLEELLDTAISEIRQEIMQTDNREYRKMLQARESELKKIHLTLSSRIPEKKIPTAV